MLRTGGTAQTLGCVVKAPSTLGTFLRSFRWGHVRQLDRVSRELLARAWSAGAGPGDAPFTIDLDSTICETYGLAKEGARDHGYTGKRGYHPLLAVAAGTGDVLMARLREGRANTARGAAHFLRETVSCVRRWGGCATPGPGDNSRCGPTAASTPTPSSPPAARWMSASPSPSASSARLRSLIEAIPEQDWTPIPYWMEGAADVAETSYTPFQSKPDAAPVRLIVRRVKPTPGSQLALFATYRYHGFITDREGETPDRGRYGAEIGLRHSLGRRTAIRHLGCETTRCRRPAMRLPSECYQMQKTIEPHLPHLSQPQLTGLALWVCGAILAGSACQNAVASALSPWSNWYNLRQRLREWLYDGGDRANSLPDRAGRNSLLRATAAVGPLLVAVGRLGLGHRPHPQRRPDHRHRHQRGIPQLRHPRGLAHPARRPARLLDGPHRGNCCKPWPQRFPRI